MSTIARKDTLAYQLKGRPACMYRNMSMVPAPVVGKVIANYMAMDNAKETVPEHEAIWFYGMNHAVAAIRQMHDMHEPLPAEKLAVVEDYHARCNPKIVRMFYYLLLICARENRHLENKSTWKSYVVGKYGQPMFDFLCQVPDSAEGAWKFFRDHSPAVPIGHYTACLAHLFRNGQWAGGYGGEKWANIADCLDAFVWGRSTGEMMLDTAFTLSHNGGPIFNKGMQYTCHSGSTIRLVLDVQRSGQIPQLVAEGICDRIPTGAAKRMAEIAKVVPGFGAPGYVDWFQVEALGAVGKYKAYQDQQAAKYGLTEEMKAKKAAAQIALEAKMAAKIAAANAEYFIVTPTLKVAKFKRAKAA